MVVTQKVKAGKWTQESGSQRVGLTENRRHVADI